MFDYVFTETKYHQALVFTLPFHYFVASFESFLHHIIYYFLWLVFFYYQKINNSIFRNYIKTIFNKLIYQLSSAVTTSPRSCQRIKITICLQTKQKIFTCQEIKNLITINYQYLIIVGWNVRWIEQKQINLLIKLK